MATKQEAKNRVLTTLIEDANKRNVNQQAFTNEILTLLLDDPEEQLNEVLRLMKKSRKDLKTQIDDFDLAQAKAKKVLEDKLADLDEVIADTEARLNAAKVPA